MVSKDIVKRVKKFLSNPIHGIETEIIFHPDKSIQSLGRVWIIEETRKMFVVKCKDGEYRLVSKAPDAKFKFMVDGNKVVIVGRRLQGLYRQRKKHRYTTW